MQAPVTAAPTARAVLAALAVWSMSSAALADPPPAPAAASPASPESPASASTAPLEVSVIGDRAAAMQRVPGSLTVITPREIERAEARDGAELLSRVPGVVARQTTDGGGRLDIGIRGLDPGRSRRVLVLEDGVPVGNNPYAEPDVYFAPPIERVRSIEVLKGSGSLLFGPQTIGGVVNFLTIAPPEHRVARFTATAGEDGYVRWLGRYGNGNDDAGWIAQILFARDEGFRVQESKLIDVLVKTRMRLDDRQELAFKLAAHDLGALSSDVGLTQAMYEHDPRRRTLAPRDRMELQRLDFSALHRVDVGEHVQVRTLAYVAGTARVWRRQAYDRVPGPDVAYEHIVGDVEQPLGAIYFRDTSRLLDRRYVFGGLEPKVEVRAATGPLSHFFTGGLRVLGEGAELYEIDGASSTARSGELAVDQSHRAVAFSGYVVDRIGFAGDRVLITPGIRVEHVAYGEDAARVRGAAGSQAVSLGSTDDDTGIIPGLGLAAGTPVALGFAGVHVGYSPPRLSAGAGPSGLSSALPAEKSVEWELGGRARPAPFERLDVTGFATAFSNQTVANTAPGEDTELVAGGRTRHLGVEAQSTTEIGRALESSFDLDLALRYGFADARFVGGDDDGRELPYAPGHTGSAVLDLGRGIWAAEVAATFVGPSFSDDANTEAIDVTGRTGAIAAHAGLDANVRVDVPRTGLRLSVVAKNLLDAPYVAARRPEGIAVGGVRQVLLTASWDLERLGGQRERPPPVP